MGIEILIAGDFCPIGRNQENFDSNDFGAVFNGFETIAKSVDYAIVNLECPITRATKKIKKTGPCLRSNENALKALKYAGFNLLTLANNHILDYDEEGVIDTIEKASEFGFDLVGAGRNIYEAGTPLIKSFGNTKVGFLNLAENEFCAATNATAGAYTLDLVDNFNRIQSLKAQCDKVILIYHGGREHYQLPTPKLRERLRFFVDVGADGVVAHHTHCFSGYEYHNGKPIIYSLGNFVFDYKRKYQQGLWTEGMAVKLTLEDDIKIELIPFKQGQTNNPGIQFLNEEEITMFDNRISLLNKAISNDDIFYKEWAAYIKTQRLFYESSLTVQNKYLRAAITRKWIPMLPFSKSHKRLLLNLFRCESHSEISQEVLQKYSK